MHHYLKKYLLYVGKIWQPLTIHTYFSERGDVCTIPRQDQFFFVKSNSSTFKNVAEVSSVSCPDLCLPTDLLCTNNPLKSDA